jgi:hypothetical protein
MPGVGHKFPFVARFARPTHWRRRLIHPDRLNAFLFMISRQTGLGRSTRFARQSPRSQLSQIRNADFK